MESIHHRLIILYVLLSYIGKAQRKITKPSALLYHYIVNHLYDISIINLKNIMLSFSKIVTSAHCFYTSEVLVMKRIVEC